MDMNTFVAVFGTPGRATAATPATPSDPEYLKDMDGNNILDIDGNPIPVIT